jgi:hypothetical protein
MMDLRPGRYLLHVALRDCMPHGCQSWISISNARRKAVQTPRESPRLPRAGLAEAGAFAHVEGMRCDCVAAWSSPGDCLDPNHPAMPESLLQGRLSGHIAAYCQPTLPTLPTLPSLPSPAKCAGGHFLLGHRPSHTAKGGGEELRAPHPG